MYTEGVAKVSVDAIHVRELTCMYIEGVAEVSVRAVLRALLKLAFMLCMYEN